MPSHNLDIFPDSDLMDRCLPIRHQLIYYYLEIKSHCENINHMHINLNTISKCAELITVNNRFDNHFAIFNGFINS